VPPHGPDLRGHARRSAGMSTRSCAGAAVAAFALAAPVAPAAADGLPLPVEDSPSGVLSLDGSSRYLSITLGDRTAVLAQNASGGAVTSRTELRGRFTIPLVAYDSTGGGISGDGHTLVLIRPRRSFPRRDTTFAVLSAAPRLRLRRVVRLHGDFSYDALSPDGRTLFLINYISPADPRRYRVRAYDLVRGRLDPRPIVDPREPPDEMNGLPLARVSSPHGRWAFTLYDGERPFIHALDTRDRKAVCIDLEGAVFRGVGAHELGIAIAGGDRLDVRRNGGLIASVDTATFRVGAPAAPRTRELGRGADTGSAAGLLLWPALGVVLVAAALLVRRVARRHPLAP